MNNTRIQIRQKTLLFATTTAAATSFLLFKQNLVSLSSSKSVITAFTPFTPFTAARSDSSIYSPTFCSSSSMKNSHTSYKTTRELQHQWAGGRDVWKDVPVCHSDGNEEESRLVKTTINIQTKVKPNNNIDNDDNDDNDNDDNDNWPNVIKSSILFGFGAYNPRGQTLPLSINRKQHALLQSDIQHGLRSFQDTRSSVPSSNTAPSWCWWWQGASLWEDGSSERGFIVAIHKDYIQQQHQDWIIQLAKKYDQGAIYKFVYDNGDIDNDIDIDIDSSSQSRSRSRNRSDANKNTGNGRLMRETIAVLDDGTDASVQVIKDGSLTLDLSIFDDE